jgi:predicted metalloprotease with PDZ domain
VRVRLARIDEADLNLFEFDYDLTFMVFFMSADEGVYGRYGGRDAKGPEARLSLAGLHHAMKAALDTHARQAAAAELAPPKREAAKSIRDLATTRRSRGCIHCHQVKQMLNAELEKAGKWSSDLVWRYPLPDNLGLILDIDRGDVVERVEADSPAARAGLRARDVVQRLNGIPVHSLADAQYALDRAPRTGPVELSWRRGDVIWSGELALPAGWRKTDISWRPSLQKLVPSLYLSGYELSAKEKEALGLAANHMAFRQEEGVPARARDAGIRPGDIIAGLDDKRLEINVTQFHAYVRRNYLVGDRITVNVFRNGEWLSLPLTLR